MIQNRCTNEANPLTFCPFCATWWSNTNHFFVHSDEIDEQKLRAYVKGVFSSGLRGPLYRHAVVDQITTWYKQGTLFQNIEKLFAIVGVGLTDSRTASMPLYRMDRVFAEGVVSKLNSVIR